MKALILQDITRSCLSEKISSGCQFLETKLPVNISNDIVRCLREISKLNCDTIKKLTKDQFKITEVDVSDCVIDESSLSVLLDHPLQRLSTARKFHDELGRIEMSSFTINSTTLMHWDLTGSINMTNEDLVESMKLLPNLRSLILSQTQINDDTLHRITQIKDKLDHIDLSYCENLTDISPIRRLTKLKFLYLCNCTVSFDLIEEVLQDLRSLEVLDISSVTQFTRNLGKLNMGDILFTILTTNDNCLWPNLRSLDISNNSLEEWNDEDLDSFIQTIIAKHPRLTRLNLSSIVFEGVEEKFLSYETSALTIVIGSKLVSNSIENLSTSSEISDTIRALDGLQNVLKTHRNLFDEEQINESVCLCVQAMIDYPKSFEIQILATSCCFYYLITSRNLRFIDHNLVSLFADKCITAVDYNHDLCSRLSTLHTLLSTKNIPNIDWRRMTILSIDILESTSNRFLMERSSQCIRGSIQMMHDTQMESIVMESKLVNVFMEILREFSKDFDAVILYSSPIYFILSTLITLTEKCLIARSSLVQNDIISIVFEIIRSGECRMFEATQLLINVIGRDEFENISIDSQYIELFKKVETMDTVNCYILLELLSHLLTSTAPCENIQHSSDQLNQILVDAVHRMPRERFVFDDIRFCMLLRMISRDDAPGAQLFSVWRIHILCEYPASSANRIKLLQDRGGVDSLRKIVESSASEELKKIANDLLDLVK